MPAWEVVLSYSPANALTVAAQPKREMLAMHNERGLYLTNFSGT